MASWSSLRGGGRKKKRLNYFILQETMNLVVGKVMVLLGRINRVKFKFLENKEIFNLFFLKKNFTISFDNASLNFYE